MEAKVWDIMEICTKLRDEILPHHGILLEDYPDLTSVANILDKDLILKKKQTKEKRVVTSFQNITKKNYEQTVLSPQEYFVNKTDSYSKFDENGLPTHDVNGNPLSKNASKKLRKQYEKMFTIQKQP
jgi:cysteinyl-tRNA synthetase